MTDRTDSKEREAPDHGQLVAIYKQANGEDVGKAQPLTTKRIINAMRAAFQAGRASLAANAGSEPVAPEWWRKRADEIEAQAAATGSTEAMRCYTDMRTLLQAAALPSPQEGMVGGWTALPGALPEPGTPVLLDIGKKYPIRAMWAAKFTVVAVEHDADWGEYNEATDTYYCPEGWYEWNEHEETHWAVSATPRAWAPLPPTSSADSRKGE